MHDEFIAKSEISKEILNSANLLKNLNVNTLIQGQLGTGKISLAKHIAEDASIYGASILQKDLNDNVLMISDCTVIIKDIDEFSNIELFKSWVSKNSIRVIATTTKEDLGSALKDFFTIDLKLPPLKERKKDVKALIDKFSKEAISILGLENNKPKKIIIKLEENAHSLRQSVFFSYLFESIGENEIMMLLEKYMLEHMEKEQKEENEKEGKNHYRDLLYLYEAPILKASQKRYKSQLQMAKHLGLNRITLRKKLDAYKDILGVRG